ncbi:MAG TPA: GNAT family N-acetyltransferase [Terracidiphilus sp.]
MTTSMPGVHVRIATALDRPRLVSVINAAFAIETFLEGTRTDDERLAAMMQKGEILVAEDDSGSILASIYAELRDNRGYLGMLAVDPAYQRFGLGKSLLFAAEDHFRTKGCDAIDITVLSLRPELRPIYSRLGFVETGTEEFVPTRPLKESIECHCIVMSKPL